MKSSIRNKLENLADRLEELSALLSDANIINNQEKFRDYSKEYAEIKPIVDGFDNYRRATLAVQQAKELLNDLEMRELAEEELQHAQQEQETLEQTLQLLLLPRDPDDNSNVFLEVRAGTGGDEAAIFAGDLVRMYMRYAERQVAGRSDA